MSKIKLGIIGAGSISEKHLEVLSSLDNISIEAISSRTLSKAKKLAKKFNIKFVYKDYLDFFSKLNLDGILILVSPENIYKVTKILLKYKKPLFIEKPIGLNISETEKLINSNKIYKTLTMVGLNRRFYSVFHKGIKKINEKGKLLGLHIEGHERFWKIGNIDRPKIILDNWIYANGTHTIDLLRFFGGDIKYINTFTTKLKERNGDQFVASLEFDSGSLGTYTSHWFSPGGWSVKLYGVGVTVEYKPLEKGIWINTDFQEREITPDEVDLKYKPGFYRQMEAFGKMVRTGKLDWPGVDLEKALKTMELAQKFYDA